MAIRTNSVFIDSINENTCKLLIGEKGIPVEMPAIFLPKGSSEGDWLYMTFELSRELGSKNEETIKNLLDKIVDKE